MLLWFGVGDRLGMLEVADEVKCCLMRDAREGRAGCACELPCCAERVAVGAGEGGMGPKTPSCAGGAAGPTDRLRRGEAALANAAAADWVVEAPRSVGVGGTGLLEWRAWPWLREEEEKVRLRPPARSNTGDDDVLTRPLGMLGLPVGAAMCGKPLELERDMPCCVAEGE